MKNNLPIKGGLIALIALSTSAYSMDSRSTVRPLRTNKRFQQVQPRVLSGKILDEKNISVPGVTVKNNTSGKSTISDADGNFRIEVAGPNDQLTFSFIGYQAQTIKAGEQATLNVKLAPAKELNLKEVVVVGVGYGSLKQREVTSSVAHVDTSDFRQSGSRNALDLIQGKVAGLQITRSGGSNPNSSPSVQLRGVVSVTGSASPLFVIDGIPGGNPDLLQQDDIASIDVLKDGSGAAIYGTSANAGVIIITTKKGKSGPPQFNYSSYIRKESIYNRPDFLTAEEFRQKIESGQLKQTDFGSNTDFFDQLVNHDNFSQNHNLSMSGGTDKTNYRASLNYRNLEGIAKEDDRQEYTARLNINQKGLKDKLNMQVNLATNFNNANLLGGGGWEEEATKNPTLSNYNPDGTYRFDLTSTNQFARLSQETNKRLQQTTSADAKVDLDIIEGLRGSIFGSVQRNSYIDRQYHQLLSEDSQENSDYPGGGYAFKGTSLYQDFALEPTISYNKKIGEHNLSLLGGYSYRYHVEEGQTENNRGFLNDNFHEDNIADGQAIRDGKADITSFKNDNTLIAFFGRVNYSFMDRYLLQFILRHEGSSRFGANNKWGNFPAVSAGWNISQEAFMKNLTFVNYLKLRAGYGVTGNSGFSNNASRVTLGGGGRYIYPDGTYRETYGPNTNPNPDLRWETKRETNIGMDFRLFNNNLSGSLDFFNRTTKDLLDQYDTPVPPYIQTSIYANVGTLSSKGIELALSYSAIRNKNLTWSMDVTASTLSNKLNSYSNSTYTRKFITTGPIGGAGDLGDAFTIFEGGKIGEFFGKRFAGFDADGKWLFYSHTGEKIYNDQINNSRDDLTATDLAPIGNAIPKYYASFTSNLTYKNFDFRVFLRGKFDYDILNTTALSYGNKTWSGNLLRDAFTKYSELNDTYMYSDYYLENGSNLKIDEVTLGYTFRFKAKAVRSLRLYVTGQNLGTITGYSGNDPDYVLDTGIGNADANGQVLGVDSRGPYPTTRSFLFGVNFGF